VSLLLDAFFSQVTNKSQTFKPNDPRSIAVIKPKEVLIHFALHKGTSKTKWIIQTMLKFFRGTKSCPAIRVYGQKDVYQELRAAAESYCSTEVALIPEKKLVRLLS